MNSLWRGTRPLVLASKSEARQGLLRAAGIPFEAHDAAIDERALEAPLIAKGAAASEVARHLARAKALAISAKMPGHLVVGADQVACLKGRLFAKPADQRDAIAQLEALSGQIHELHSACCVVRQSAVLFESVPKARLSCRRLSPEFIACYAAQGGIDSNGVYKIEGLGIHLFDWVEGDHATILGLPLLVLLKFLREEGSILS